MHEKIWLKHYPSNIPTEVRYDEYPNLNSFIRATIREYGDQVAFISMDKKLTYNQLDKYADQFAAYLASLGMKPGDKLALMMPNILQYPIALFAAIRAGYIVVNTNPLYTPREMKLQFQDAGVTAIVIAENFAYNLQQIIGETKIKHVITASIGEMLGGLKGPLVNFVIRKVKKMVPAYNLPGSVSFKKALGEVFQNLYLTTIQDLRIL